MKMKPLFSLWIPNGKKRKPNPEIPKKGEGGQRINLLGKNILYHISIFNHLENIENIKTQNGIQRIFTRCFRIFLR